MVDTNGQHSKPSDPTDASFFSWLDCCSRNRAARGGLTPSQPPTGFSSGSSSLSIVAVLHAELYALLDLQPQQKPLDSHPERQPTSHAPTSHAPASHGQPAQVEPTQCGQPALGDGTVMQVRSHHRPHTALVSPQFSAQPEPCDETELGERQHGEWGLCAVRPVRQASLLSSEQRCGTCLVAIGSDATIFMARDTPFCSATCQMCTPCPLKPSPSLFLRLYTSLHLHVHYTSTSTCSPSLSLALTFILTLTPTPTLT